MSARPCPAAALALSLSLLELAVCYASAAAAAPVSSPSIQLNRKHGLSASTLFVVGNVPGAAVAVTTVGMLSASPSVPAEAELAT